MRACACTYVCKYAGVCEYVYVRVRVRVCVCVCVFVCVFIAKWYYGDDLCQSLSSKAGKKLQSRSR